MADIDLQKFNDPEFRKLFEELTEPLGALFERTNPGATFTIVARYGTEAFVMTTDSYLPAVVAVLEANDVYRQHTAKALKARSALKVKN